MDLLKIIKNSHNTHDFLDKKVDKSKLKKIIDAGRYAPSSHNSQDWKFIIIKDKKILSELFDLCVYGEFYSISPVGIVIVAEPLYYDDEKKGLLKVEEKLVSHKYMNIGFATQNMVLEAQALGVDYAILSLDVKKANKILNVPKKSESLLMLALGYRKKGSYKKIKDRKKTSQVLGFEKYVWDL